MFKLFKREAPPARPTRAASAGSRVPAPPPPPPASTPRRPPAAAPLAAAPLQVEVREDHDESAWSLWEESNFQLDSQMGGLSPSDSVRVKDARPSQAADLDDPFARIGKNDR